MIVATVRLLTDIRHAGLVHTEGSIVVLEAELAERLVRLGLAERADARRARTGDPLLARREVLA